MNECIKIIKNFKLNRDEGLTLSTSKICYNTIILYIVWWQIKWNKD